MKTSKDDQALFNALTDYAVEHIDVDQRSILVPAMIELLGSLEDNDLQWRLEAAIFNAFKNELRKALGFLPLGRAGANEQKPLSADEVLRTIMPLSSATENYQMARRAQAEVLGVQPVTQPFPDLDIAMAKLVKGSPEEGGVVAWIELALKTLPWREDEATATQLLFSILLHDNLAETLNGRL